MPAHHAPRYANVFCVSPLLYSELITPTVNNGMEIMVKSPMRRISNVTAIAAAVNKFKHKIDTIWPDRALIQPKIPKQR